MKFLPSVRALKTWARQITTAVGMAGGFSMLAAIATGAVKWTQALAILQASSTSSHTPSGFLGSSLRRL